MSGLRLTSCIFKRQRGKPGDRGRFNDRRDSIYFIIAQSGTSAQRRPAVTAYLESRELLLLGFPGWCDFLLMLTIAALNRECANRGSHIHVSHVCTTVLHTHYFDTSFKLNMLK